MSFNHRNSSYAANHFNSTAASRNPLTMVGMEQQNQRPISRDVSVRSAQATPDLLQWSQSRVTPSQARSINRDKVTQSSHNLLSHQEFQAKNQTQDQAAYFQSNNLNQQTRTPSKSASSVLSQEPKFTNLTGDKRGRSHVQTANFKSMQNDADKRNVTLWSTDEDVKYDSHYNKYNKLEDNSVSGKNTEEKKRANVLHLTEDRYHQAPGTKSSNDLYQKNFKSSNGLIGGTGEGGVPTQNVKTMAELNKNFEKLSTRRDIKLNSSSLFRNESAKPRWR